MGGGVIGWGYKISCVLGREGVYMGVYYASLSFVEFWLYSYRYTVSNFVQYVVTIAKLNLYLYTIFIF